MWTHFWDMHSGGGQKDQWAHIYIEAPQEEATSVFYSRFGHNPDRVTCTCCGPDYSISEDEDLAQLTAYHRNAEWDDDLERYVERDDTSMVRFGGKVRQLVPLDDYLTRSDVRFIHADEIKDEERSTHVPESGYVWVGDS